MPSPVRAGSKVTGTVTLSRSPGATGPVEVSLTPSSWTRTAVCVVVEQGATSARFEIAVSSVTTTGQYATVGASVTPTGSDYRTATSPIVPT